jgi:hypothetical protein
MTTGEKVELALIPVFGAGLWLMAPELPDKVGVGNLLLGASAFLLLQSLIRDLWLLAREKRAAQLSPRRKARCMCVESTVGATGVIVGIILLGSGIDRSVVMNDWIWSPLVMVVMGIGFVIKDYVLEWSPLRVRRDREHVNIVFTWKN